MVTALSLFSPVVCIWPTDRSLCHIACHHCSQEPTAIRRCYPFVLNLAPASCLSRSAIHLQLPFGQGALARLSRNRNMIGRPIPRIRRLFAIHHNGDGHHALLIPCQQQNLMQATFDIAGR